MISLNVLLIFIDLFCYGIKFAAFSDAFSLAGCTCSFQQVPTSHRIGHSKMQFVKNLYTNTTKKTMMKTAMARPHWNFSCFVIPRVRCL
jgi:hypothetical protein